MDSNVRKLLFIQKCPQFSQKWSASSAGMLATFSMSEHKNINKTQVESVQLLKTLDLNFF